jgi:dienelactone hydrolase
MQVLTETTEQGVTERRFDLEIDGRTVPGIAWRPEGVAGPLPAVLIGHGGTQHKRVPNVLSLARRLVRHLGYAAYALDAPGHGDRVTDAGAADAARRRLERRIGDRSGEKGLQLSPEEAKAWVERTRRGVQEWKALVDRLETDAAIADGRLGYWGVSMGTAIGLPFVAAEPRVRAAVLGLAGLGGRPGGDDFEQAARSLTVPVLFLFQWDDELMTRDSGMALFDAIGSVDKTMHVNPGGHVAMPLHERDAVEAFYVRHLGAA